MLKKLNQLPMSIRFEAPPHASFWIPRNLSIAHLSLQSEVKASHPFDINLPSVLFIASIFIFFLYPKTEIEDRMLSQRIVRETRDPTKVTTVYIILLFLLEEYPL